jgi:hypothetical protein
MSQQALCDISQQIARQYAPKLLSPTALVANDMRLSSQALRDISTEISRDYAPASTRQPEQLVLMAVDPGHGHAYWQLDAKPEIPIIAPLTLRIFAQATEPVACGNDDLWYDAKIHGRIRQQTVSLPLDLSSRGALTQYRAELGHSNAAGKWLPLLSSNALTPTPMAPADYAAQSFTPNLSSSHLTQQLAQELL